MSQAVCVQTPNLFLLERQAEYYEMQDRKQELYQNACSLLKAVLKKPKDCSALVDLIDTLAETMPALKELQAEIERIQDDYPSPGEDGMDKDGVYE